MTSVQIGALASEDLEGFSTDDVSAITVAALAGLTTDNLAALATDQIAALKTTQVAALKVGALQRRAFHIDTVKLGAGRDQGRQGTVRQLGGMAQVHAAEVSGLALSAVALRPLAMLVQQRANRAFRVEQPAMAPLSSELRTEAMEAVPELVAALDTLDRVNAPAVVNASRPLLGEYFAQRLAELGARRPTIAQVVVTMRGHPRASIEARSTRSSTLRYAASAGSGTGTPSSFCASSTASHSRRSRTILFSGDHSRCMP